MKIVISALIVAVGLLLTLIWLWDLIDIIKGTFKKDSDKIVWLVLVLAVPTIGVILYLAYGKNQKIDLTDEFV